LGYNEFVIDAPRKSNRLQGYDYSQNGYYFVTLCVKHRIEAFGNISKDVVLLSNEGKIVKKQMNWLSIHFPYIHLDEYIIMPNHVHAIIVINNSIICGRDNPRIVPTNTVINTKKYNRKFNLLSKVINALKTTSSILIHQSGYNAFQWQRSFYDHIIRNEKSYLTIKQYIRNNPQNWSQDPENKV
jgi:REP element-mobilizing transposase RayT